MYAIVKDGAITATGNIKQLFPNTSFAGGVANADFKTAEGVKDIVQGERKDQKYYYVTQGDVELVDCVPTQKYTNTAKRLVDEDAKDDDGNQIYKQVWSDSANDGAGGFVFKGENRPIVNAGQKIFSAARTHFNKTDEPFSQTINVPDGKGGTKAVTITLSKDDVGLSKGENLNLLSQKRQTGKLRSVETEILSRIFDSFDNEGVILKKSEEENVNKKSRSKYVNVPD